MATFFIISTGTPVISVQVFQMREFRIGLRNPTGEPLVVLADRQTQVTLTEVTPAGQTDRAFNVLCRSAGNFTIDAYKILPVPPQPPPPMARGPAMPGFQFGQPNFPRIVPPRGLLVLPELRPEDDPSFDPKRVGPSQAILSLVVRKETSVVEGAETFEDVALDLLQMALDFAGIVDPTGIADGANAVMSVGRGDYLGAAISVAGLLPLLGDLAKVGKLPKHAKTIKSAIKLAAKDAKMADKFTPALAEILKQIKKLPMDKLPASAQKEIKAIEREIESFLGLLRSSRAGGGFAHGITREEIIAINRRLGGTAEYKAVDTALANAANREGFYNKAATIVRDIAGNHMFDDANKRTAQTVVEELMRRNKIVPDISSEQIRKVVHRAATGELREVESIAQALKGLR